MRVQSQTGVEEKKLPESCLSLPISSTHTHTLTARPHPSMSLLTSTEGQTVPSSQVGLELNLGVNPGGYWGKSFSLRISPSDLSLKTT